MDHAVSSVVFDLDNTLADRDAAFAHWAEWFARVRLGLTEVAEINEATSALIVLDADGYTPRDALFQAIQERYAWLADDVDILVKTFRGQLITHLPPLDRGATELLAALDKARLPWGIVTNGSSHSQRGKIRKLELEQRAGCIVISEESGMRKPDPEVFALAAGRLGVPERDVLFVGDHPEVDIVGAAKAGMRTAWLRRGRTWPAHLSTHCPDFVIDSLGELGWVAE